jgi:diadenosine tetraphosphatase ApaH/serine/threonine PP2A family protein phosphatase
MILPGVFRRAERAKTPSRVPSGVRVYAVGDIHGRADLLEEVLHHIDSDLSTCSQHVIQVFIGDYVDRGPSSRLVLDQLIERAKTQELIFLKGNHESLLIDFLNNAAVLNTWQHLGGLHTLMSYGLAPSLSPDSATQEAFAVALNEAMPDSHRHFLHNLRLFFLCGDYFFSHAGVRPGIPLSDQKEDDLLWIRKDFLSYEGGFGKIIVHGHSPVSEPEFRHNRINIDTGAYATGKLTCLILENDELIVM